MSTRRGDWSRRVEGVQWPDVWKWAADVFETFGLVVEVKLHPPLWVTRQPYGTLSVTLSAQVEGVGLQVRHHKWVALPQPGRVSAEQLALQLLVSLHQQLDTEAYAAERETVRQGGLL